MTSSWVDFAGIRRYGFALMSATSPSICVVLVVTSDTAFLDVKGTPSLIRSLGSLAACFPSKRIIAAATQAGAPAVRKLLGTADGLIEYLIPTTLEPDNLAMALENSLQDVQAVLLHDASRPLTSRAQFESVLAAFNDETDAVRPAMAFTETLKILDEKSVIKRTLDRSTVFRISTPELIRVSAIDINGADCGWFLPLKKNARTMHIEGSPDGLRVNTANDRDLMELGAY